MQHPRVGIGVFVWKNGKFLIMQRWGSHGEGTWSLPGGHLEFGETWEQAAKREVLEETGMSIKNVAFLAATNDIFGQENKHYITIWVSTDWKAGKAQNLEPEKCRGMDWIRLKELPDKLFQPCWDNLRVAKPDIFL
jgi:8-oxo-dGTP diphosphatase